MDKGIEKHDQTRPKAVIEASGKPGDKPRWSSGAKTIVGTAAAAQSRIWFTVGQGVIDEIYYPDVDQANTRSVRFLVSDGEEFFSDEEWDAEHSVSWLAPGIPACTIESRCKAGRYILTKEIITDPVRDVLLMRVRFKPSESSPKLKLYLFVEPQVGDQGADNDAWVGQYKGIAMLIAKRDRTSLAVATDPTFEQASAGYKGTSDGCTQLKKHCRLPESNTANKGNVTLTAEIDTSRSDGEFMVSIGYGVDPAEAAQQARAGVLQQFGKTQALFQHQWQEEQGTYREIADLSGQPLDMYRVSTAVLETHQSKRFPGAFVASLSMPWGFDRSDKDVGGYHVLWPRDMVETAMGKLASGDAESARSALFYLACTQDQEGGWSQNMWLDGTPHWGAVQMDGMALPILLADKLRQLDSLDGYDPLPMVRGAVRFLLKHGPVTQQDRWETTPGYSPYTMATEVAALLAAAAMFETVGETNQAEFLRETADAWNDSIDELTYLTGGDFAKEHGIDGFYMRMTPPERIEKAGVGSLKILMPNLYFGSRHQRADQIVSPDALALVRFGLRAADDPGILNTIKLIDATLKRDTATGPVWIRSTKDGYGEKKDGTPFKKTGIGRGWPLLAGERAHYEIAAGNPDYALELLRTMAKQTSMCGMIPEQIWDASSIPERFLFNGHPAGSGMPLVWAHSEYIKLLRSLDQGSIWDLPTQTAERYLGQQRSADFQIWTEQQRRGFLTRGKDLRIDLSTPASIRWIIEGEEHSIETEDRGSGRFTATLPISHLAPGTEIEVNLEPKLDHTLEVKSFKVQVQ